jgi:hypothetical protein
VQLQRTGYGESDQRGVQEANSTSPRAWAARGCAMRPSRAFGLVGISRQEEEGGKGTGRRVSPIVSRVRWKLSRTGVLPSGSRRKLRNGFAPERVLRLCLTAPALWAADTVVPDARMGGLDYEGFETDCGYVLGDVLVRVLNTRLCDCRTPAKWI